MGCTNPSFRRTRRTVDDRIRGIAAAAVRTALALGLAVAAALSPRPALAQNEDECGAAIETDDVPEILRLLAGGAWNPPEGLPDDILAAPIAIPVTVHVVRRDDQTGAIPAAQISQSFIDLNAAWKPMHMFFYQCGPIYFIDSTEHYNLNSWAERNDLVATLAVPDTINLYFVASLAVDGTSYCGVASGTHKTWQGVVVVDNCAGVPSNPTTVPHEFGHYFDLYHTHDTGLGAELVDGSNCDVAGDLVCDTPADPKLTSANTTGCAYDGTELDGNGDPYEPDTSNYMSYAGKLCRTTFSPDQVQRARATLFNLRPNLIGGGCAWTLAEFSGTPPPPGAGGPPPQGRPVLFARRACDAASGPCRTAPGGGTTDDFVTASIDVVNSTPAPLRLNLRIEADLTGLVPGGATLRDVTRYFRPVAGGAPIENPMSLPPGTTSLALDVKKAIGAGLVDRLPANVPFIARLEAPGPSGLVIDYSIGLLGLRPAAGYYDDCVVEDYRLSRDPVQSGDALVVRFDARDLPDPAAGWDIRGAQIVGAEIGGSGLPGLPLVELRLEDPANPGQPDMSSAGLLRSAGPVAFDAAPSTRYADFADLVHFPPGIDTPALFVLAYLNPGDSLATVSTATAIAGSTGADGAVLVGNSSILLGGATPLVPIDGRDLMIRLDLNGALTP